ncbi:hypothetical protein MIR68_003210 [Amoeboaphelidium protococcarum]|nr:hypothetical protein MIR68_003210 [Amoeboaphelidium protococcarum]
MKQFTEIALLLLAGVCSVTANQQQHAFTTSSEMNAERFDGHKLVSVCDKSASTLKFFQEMDVWGGDDKCLYVKVSPEEMPALDQQGISYGVMNHNIQKDVDAELARMAIFQMMPASVQTDNWFSEFHRYEEIKAWYKNLAERNSEFIRFIPSIGKTYEGRDLFAIEINTPNGVAAEKKQIYFQSQIHAREWISGATVQYVVNKLVDQFNSGDEEVVELFSRVELLVVPIVNPDGYEYTHTANRLWRKNRKLISGRTYGVDLNRNYDVNWDFAGGASKNPNSETYKGETAASENEIQAVTNFFLNHTRIVGAIDFHSFSQLVLRPLGHTNRKPRDYDRLKAVGDGISSAIKSVNGKVYKNMPSVDLYPTSGSAHDWFYASEDVKKRYDGQRIYGFTIELRPRTMWEGGFIISPRQIVPTGEEIYNAMLYFMDEAEKNPLY